jgi:chromate transporter
VTAAVVGLIANLSLWFALHTLFGSVQTLHVSALKLAIPVWSSLDVMALGLIVTAFVALFRFQLGLGWILLGAGLTGTLLSR